MGEFSGRKEEEKEDEEDAERSAALRAAMRADRSAASCEANKIQTEQKNTNKRTMEEIEKQ